MPYSRRKSDEKLPVRLLLVEDHPELAEWIGKALSQVGYVVDHMIRGDHADQALATEPYDLVILDLSLPKMDGLEVLRRHRRPSAWAQYGRRRLPAQAVRTG
jgi:two-component system response regulator TctD